MTATQPATAGSPATPPMSPTPTGRSRALRTDIQGLRAIAVSAVLVYHLGPGRVSGGFVGVDVFFVISGFLITSHLLANPPSRPRDLFDFWSRRIRRLLPASLLVLTTVLVASRLVAPETQWANTAAQVRSAALFVVNWRLASDSVDYLAAENAPSPVQHYWSLSLEEQFYLGWPVLLLVLVAAAALVRWRLVPVLAGGVALLVAASFAYSVHLTTVDPVRAYFVTPTRVWELGAGGLLAVAVAGRGRSCHGPTLRRVIAAWLGVALVIGCVAGYDAATPFPGWQAAIPVAGALLIIGADAPAHTRSPGWWLALRPVQWLGDVSYSVYLWHWPLIVLVPAVTGSKLGLPAKLAVIAATLVLAQLTKTLVEDRWRRPGRRRPPVVPFVAAALGIALVVAAATVQTTEVRHRAEDARQARNAALSGADPCFGAPALGRVTCQPTTRGALTPEPVAAAADKSKAYDSVPGGRDCFSFSPSFRDVRCTFGAPAGRVRIALVGNSHAGQWVDTIDMIAKQHGWRVTTYLASRCASSAVDQSFATAAQSAACRRWVDRTTREVAAAKYDVVIMTNRISLDAAGTDLAGSQPRYRAGYRPLVTEFLASGAHVVGIRDTPAPDDSIPDCLAEHTEDYSRCDGTRSAWLPGEPLAGTLRDVADPRAVLADLTDRLCLPTVCPAVIGRVPVYFDGSHMTSTFSRTLAPYLTPYLVAAVSR